MGAFPLIQHSLARLFLALCLLGAGVLEAADIKKVLPHYLDEKGRHTMHPSLYDRDAYQAELRSMPEKRTALRFDVQWKAREKGPLKLRVEAKGMHARTPRFVTLEREIGPGIRSQWTSLILEGDDYKRFGDLVTWRATLLSGTNVVAEEKSFLW